MTPEEQARADLRERIAKAIYEREPWHEPGEWLEGFCVAPGGNLSWEQAKGRDAEFAPDFMPPITKDAYDFADHILASARAAHEAEIEALVSALERASKYLADLSENLLRNDVDMMLDPCEDPADLADALAQLVQKHRGK